MNVMFCGIICTSLLGIVVASNAYREERNAPRRSCRLDMGKAIIDVKKRIIHVVLCLLNMDKALADVNDAIFHSKLCFLDMEKTLRNVKMTLHDIDFSLIDIKKALIHVV